MEQVQPPAAPARATAVAPERWGGCCLIKDPSTNHWSSPRRPRGTSRDSAPDTKSTGETNQRLLLSGCLHACGDRGVFWFEGVFRY